MVAASKTIEVLPGSELDRLLDEAAARPIVLVRGGTRYRFDPDAPAAEGTAAEPAKRDPWANYDPERLMEGVRAAAGSITEEVAEKLIADISRWREEGTRPPDRP